jgi:hypothetical protein
MNTTMVRSQKIPVLVLANPVATLIRTVVIASPAGMSTTTAHSQINQVPVDPVAIRIAHRRIVSRKATSTRKDSHPVREKVAEMVKVVKDPVAVMDPGVREAKEVRK